MFSITVVVCYSDEYTELYPYASDSSNVGGTHMKTAQEIKEEKIVTHSVEGREMFCNKCTNSSFSLRYGP